MSTPSNSAFRSGRGATKQIEIHAIRIAQAQPTDQVITHNYLPPRGSEPLRVEILALKVEEVRDIMRRWEPFHCEASAADQLDNLYPHIYRVPVTARGMGLLEDYSMTLPASTPKEDFLQIIDDGIQVRNRNFV